jgi:hypothetical protein
MFRQCHDGQHHAFVRGLWSLAIALLLVGCARAESVSLPEAFPGADAAPGWAPSGDVEIFDNETIFNLVDGLADAFFVYGFEQVAVQNYENAEGAALGIEIWQLATPADAYGLFTASIAGEPADICPSTGSGRCNEGDADPGRRLVFWQNRYVVHVRARQAIDDAVLRSSAAAVSAALPEGGERPALVDRLPPEGLIERSAIFFHEEISIQNDLWLGGENLLRLSQETGGVLARYEVGGAVARLLLVQYPDAEAASDGLGALESGQVDALVTADARDNLLGAVFGEIEEAAADELLSRALDGQQ